MKGERHSLFSVSKSFTAVAVLFALQEGLLSLEDKVVSFFPEKLPARPCPNMEKLAVRHLLTMTPGLAAAPHNFRYPHLDDVINDFPYSYENFSYENKVDWVADFLHSYLPNPPGRSSSIAPPAHICSPLSCKSARDKRCSNTCNPGC